MENRSADILKLVLAVMISVTAGWIGSLFTSMSVSTWYQTLEKPTFTPPSSVFGPVWTTLYLLMGVAAWLIWRQGLDKPGVRVALIAFLVQLGLNTLWSVLFFGLRNPLYGLVDIALLWIAILITILAFYRLSKPASALLLPYIAWVSFAAVLNYYIWRLNS